jgi:hypothetical protein
MRPLLPLLHFTRLQQATCAARALCTCCLLLSMALPALANKEEDPDYDEIPIYISVTGVGSTEVPAIIYNQYVYLSVSHVFDFLKIKNVVAANGDSVSGFFIQPKNYYVIDKLHRRLVVGDKMIRLKENDVFVASGNLYLKSTYFGIAFGLNCSFNFRSLTVLMNTQLELPVVREMRQESMRNNIRRLTGAQKVDTNITGGTPLFHAGTADWSVITTQNSQGINNTRFNVALGAIIAGGETTLGLNYDSYTGFTNKQQYYLWRLVNNDRKALRQVMLGKIAPQAVSTLYAPVVGVQLTNTPTTYRRSFGTYVLSDRTEPNWMVELYVNNVMVNYVKADAAGFFSFEVPLVYGNSSVKLRYYGPYGEERITEKNINVPFNFLPQGQFEYTATAGMVEDSVHSRYARVASNYGLGKSITVGGGAEYLSSVATGKFMPFVNASVRLASNLLLMGDYMHGVRMKQVLSYRLPSDLQFELMYSRYKKGQRAINNTFLEERRAVISYPFRGKHFAMFSRLTVYQILLPPTKTTASSRYTNVEALFSGMLLGVNTNFTTYALVTNAPNPYIYSNLSATFRLPAKILLTPQVQFEYNERKLISYKGEAGKYLSSKGFANVFYENNIKSGFRGVGVGLRYDLSFAQASVSTRRTNDVTTTVESARGSFLFNRKAGYFNANNRSSVGKGGIIVAPYLDLNANGVRDKGEHRVSGLRLQVNAGRVRYLERDTTIIITELEAYVSYTVKLSTEGFDQVSWQIKNKVLGIGANPNQLRMVEIPVVPMGEVTGTLSLQDSTGIKGQGRMILRVFNAAGKQVAQTISESDGYYSFPGLVPGTYTLRMDAEQLGKLDLLVDQLLRTFTLIPSEEGAVVDKMDFVLKRKEQ